MKIILVGPYPPPFGGVSIHLQRLADYMTKKGMNTLLIDVSRVKVNALNVINLSQMQMFFYLLFRQSRAIVHFHVISIKLIILYFILSYKHDTLLSFHNERFMDLFKSKGKLFFNIISFMLRTHKTVIVNNDKCKELAKEIIDINKLRIIAEFIPEENIPDLESQKIINLRQKHKFLLSSNAWKISFHNGQDLYGIDLLIELMNFLVNEKKLDAVFVFLLPTIADKQYFGLLNKKIDEYELKDKFVIITDPLKSASSLWKVSDLVIRATNTDGNSVSVLEALAVGTPVLVSDCTVRPDTSVLFKTRNIDDLKDKTMHILENIDLFKKKLNQKKIESNADKILNVYADLISGKMQ